MLRFTSSRGADFDEKYKEVTDFIAESVEEQKRAAGEKPQDSRQEPEDGLPSFVTVGQEPNFSSRESVQEHTVEARKGGTGENRDDLPNFHRSPYSEQVEDERTVGSPYESPFAGQIQYTQPYKPYQQPHNQALEHPDEEGDHEEPFYADQAD